MLRVTHCELPQNCWPPGQSQTPLWHCRPPVQTVLQLPQWLLSLWRFTQSEPHAEKELLQLIPHDVPLHVAEPFDGTGHGELHDELPQVAVLKLLAHDVPHGW
jgi:hypothetical protein